MAFKDVGQNYDRKQKATEMKVGESLTGHVVSSSSREYDGEVRYSMIINVGGERVLFFPAGNIKYLIKDGNIKAGLLTKITRLADGKTKGKTSTKFSVQQDDSDTIPVAADNTDYSQFESSAPKVTKQQASLAAKAKTLSEAN
jgi:hypothetical protein